jgi:signal transduction histidine kinase
LLAAGWIAEQLGGVGSAAFRAEDLAAGWLIGGAGAVAATRWPGSWTGPLLIATSLAWFVGTLGGAADAGLAAIGAFAVTLHRGPLVHALVTYPTGPVRDRASAAAVVSGYAFAAIPAFGASDVLSAALCGLLVWVVGRQIREAPGLLRPAKLVALVAAVAATSPLALGSLGRIVGAGPGIEAAAAALYPLGIAVAALRLTVDLVRRPWESTEIERLVVDLGGQSRAGIRGELATALGDPSLELSFRFPERGEWVDEYGQPAATPGSGNGRVASTIAAADGSLGAIVHDPTVLDDPETIARIGAVATIAASNLRLQRENEARVRELRASRARIVDVTDRQRKALQAVLRDRVGTRLEAVRASLVAATIPPNAAATATALGQLAAASEAVDRLAAGLHPEGADDQTLDRALEALGGRAGVAVRLEIPPDLHLPGAVARAVYFVCSETLANVRKHAGATRVDVRLIAASGRVVLVVSDDGRGGADLSGGSGLRGLRDRVEAIGGDLTLESPPGAGTRVTATIPVDATDPAATPNSPGSAQAMPRLDDEDARLA